MKNIKYAIKFIRRQAFNNSIRLLSITLGLFIGIVGLAWVSYEFSYDKMYSEHDRIYQLFYISSENRGKSFNEQVASLMKEDFPQIEAATRSLDSYSRKIYLSDGKEYSAARLYVDTSFFDIFDFKIISGNPHEILSKEEAVMISESFSKRLFGDEIPIGKALEDPTEKKLYTIMGVYEDMPKNNHHGRYEIISSLSRYYKPGADPSKNQNFYTYLKLGEGVQPSEIEDGMDAFIEKHNLITKEEKNLNKTFILTPITNSHNNGFAYFPVHIIMLSISILTLLVASLNFILLSISILLKRTKTIGMLKCSGASRADIFKITLWENAFLILLATLLSAFLIFACKDVFSQMMYVSISELFSLSNIWSSVLVVLSTILFVGLVNGLMSSKIPAKAALLSKSTGRSFWKKALLFIQLIISTSAVVLLIYISIQIDRMEHNDLGYNKNNLYHLSVSGKSETLDYLKNQMAEVAGVTSSSYISALPVYGWNASSVYDEKSIDSLFYARRLYIADNYLEFMQTKLIGGENISSSQSANQVLINESYACEMGWRASEALGKSIILDNDKATSYMVIGVVEDFRMGEYGVFRPCVMHPLKYDENRNTSVEMLIRTDGLSNTTYGDIHDKLVQLFQKEFYIYDYTETHRERLAYEIGIQQMLMLASLICLFITIMGLIGFIGEEMTRRRKEIAIRKINGATSYEIILHIIKGTLPFSLTPIVIALIITYIGAGFLIIYFPADNRAPLSWWIFLAAAVVVSGVVLAVVVLRSLNTARENPVDAIKE